jgi:KaiC/GvpD/RAD55 family RecA-like ATPase
MPLLEPKRIRSGISGFDDLIGGGIPEGNLIVVSGDPGSGKTSFCLGFLYHGAKDYQEPGVFISLEESEVEVTKEAAYYGFDFTSLVKQRLLLITTVSLYDFDKLKNTIEEAIESIHAKRLIIDPGVVFRLFFEKELEARKTLLNLGKMLKRLRVTAVITNELSLDKINSLFGLEEFVADGVILLYHTKLENRFIRSIGVLKMRGTHISEKLHPIEIGADGIRVLSKQELFEEL